MTISVSKYLTTVNKLIGRTFLHCIDSENKINSLTKISQVPILNRKLSLLQ